MSTLTPNAVLSGYATFSGVDGAGKDATVTVGLAPVGGSVVVEVGEPGYTLREDLTRRGVGFDVVVVVNPLAMHTLGVTPAARDRVQVAMQNFDGSLETAEVFTVTDVLRPASGSIGGSLEDWALVLTRGGGDYSEAAP